MADTRVLTKKEVTYFKNKSIDGLMDLYFKPYVTNVYKCIFKDNLEEFFVALFDEVKNNGSPTLRIERLYENEPSSLYTAIWSEFYDWAKNKDKWKYLNGISKKEYLKRGTKIPKYIKNNQLNSDDVLFIINACAKRCESKQEFFDKLFESFAIDNLYNALKSIRNFKKIEEQLEKALERSDGKVIESGKNIVKKLAADGEQIRFYRNKFLGHFSNADIPFYFEYQNTLNNAIKDFAFLMQKDEFNNKKEYEEIVNYCDQIDEQIKLEPISFAELKEKIENFDESLLFESKYENQIDKKKKVIYAVTLKEIEDFFIRFKPTDTSLSIDEQVALFRKFLESTKTAQGSDTVKADEVKQLVPEVINDDESNDATKENVSQQNKVDLVAFDKTKFNVLAKARLSPASLNKDELDNLLENTIIFQHRTLLLNENARKYVDHLITKEYKNKNLVACIDLKTRLELFNIETNSNENENLIRQAKYARTRLSLLHFHKLIHYVDAPKGMEDSDEVLIYHYAKRHPENRFVVLFDIAKINERTKFIKMMFEANVKNIIPVLVKTKKDDEDNIIGELKIDSKAKPIFASFCNLTTNNDVEDSDEDESNDIQETLDTNETLEDRVQDTKEENSTDDVSNDLKIEDKKEETIKDNAPSNDLISVLKEINKKEESSPVIKHNAKLVKETNELIKVNKLPVVGDYAYYDNGEKAMLKEQVADGGEGIIYVLENGHAGKIYKENRLTKFRRDKLIKMMDIGDLDGYFCKPLKLLYNDENIFIGYEMEMLDKKYVTLQKSVLQLSKPTFAKEKMPNWDRRTLAYVAKKLAKAVKVANDNGLIIGDLNSNNIMIDITNSEKPDLKFVDFDSMQYDGYPCPVYLINFTNPQIYIRENSDAPNFGSFLRIIDDDMYALAVMIFRILMLNTEPFIGKGNSDAEEAMKAYNFAYKTRNNSDSSDIPDGPARMIWNHTPSNIKDLFSNVFELKKTVDVDTWIRSLNFYIKQIDNGNFTKELMPKMYRDTKDKEWCVYFKCDSCGEDTNMPTQMYEIRKRSIGILTCPTCYQRLLALKDKAITPADDKKMPRMFKCKSCGKTYEAKNYYDATIWTALPERYGLCKECKGSFKTSCEKCGKEITYSKKVSYLNNKKNLEHIYCDSCEEEIKNKQYPCSGCGKMVKPTFYKEAIRYYVDPKANRYCGDCKKPYVTKCAKCGDEIKYNHYGYYLMQKEKYGNPWCEKCKASVGKRR